MESILPGWSLSTFASNLAVGSGLFLLGYHLGSQKPKKKTSRVGKSYYSDNPVIDYCVQNSTPMQPVQAKLIEETLGHKKFRMMGAPEVVNLNAALIRAVGAEKVIDVGVFTGASSLAAALALPETGKVVACDIDEDIARQARKYWVEAGVSHKVDLRIGPAANTLRDLIDRGEAGTFDFAFVDADKPGYDGYYELCLTLVRPGGIIAFDNTLWSGKVVEELVPGDRDTAAIKALNEKLANDSARSFVCLVNIGDGYTIAVKQ